MKTLHDPHWKNAIRHFEVGKTCMDRLMRYTLCVEQYRQRIADPRKFSYNGLFKKINK